MSKLSDTLLAVKDENLNKTQLEDYFKVLCELKGEVRMELAGVKKEKALFMLKNPEQSVAQRKIDWSAGEKGQREIDLVAYLGALTDNLNSVKTRIYALL